LISFAAVKPHRWDDGEVRQKIKHGLSGLDQPSDFADATAP
jgi:hypothetical protein